MNDWEDAAHKSNVIIYTTEDGLTKIDVKLEDETVWLTQAQLVELYQTSKYKAKTLSDVEQDYLNSLQLLQKKANGK